MVIVFMEYANLGVELVAFVVFTDTGTFDRSLVNNIIDFLKKRSKILC